MRGWAMPGYATWSDVKAAARVAAGSARTPE